MSAIPEMIGRYRIEAVLGRGAMGVIYRAHDPEIDRPVAIKLIRAEAPARAHDVRHQPSGGRAVPVVPMGSWNARKELTRYVGPIARVLLKSMAAEL
jgi:serine/threonine protein kinase